MILTVPDHIAAASGLSEPELLTELAVSLYAGSHVTLVQAADLLPMRHSAIKGD